MNILDQIQVKQNPASFDFERLPLVMSAVELEYLPALMAEKVKIPIDIVHPLIHVGRVMVFDVTPHKVRDPRFIFCAGVDLEWYYHLWGRVVVGTHYFDWREERSIITGFEEAMRAMNISRLAESEAAFLMLELLRFKNDVLRRHL
jgi:hypothetical protein